MFLLTWFREKSDGLVLAISVIQKFLNLTSVLFQTIFFIISCSFSSF